jgi:hypothetical protein
VKDRRSGRDGRGKKKSKTKQIEILGVRHIDRHQHQKLKENKQTELLHHRRRQKNEVENEDLWLSGFFFLKFFEMRSKIPSKNPINIKIRRRKCFSTKFQRAQSTNETEPLLPEGNGISIAFHPFLSRKPGGSTFPSSSQRSPLQVLPLLSKKGGWSFNVLVLVAEERGFISTYTQGKKKEKRKDKLLADEIFSFFLGPRTPEVLVGVHDSTASSKSESLWSKFLAVTGFAVTAREETMKKRKSSTKKKRAREKKKKREGGSTLVLRVQPLSCWRERDAGEKRLKRNQVYLSTNFRQSMLEKKKNW